MKDKFKKMVLAVAGYLVVKNILYPAAEGHRQKTENRLRAKNLRKEHVGDFRVISFHDLD